VNELPDTPVTVEAEIRQTVTWITRGVDACHAAYEAKLAAARAYDVAFARAYVEASGPQAEKRYLAELATVTEREARDVADAAHRYAEAKARTLRDRLDSLRSIGASVRLAYRASGV
jgi:hypothetical protein